MTHHVDKRPLHMSSIAEMCTPKGQLDDFYFSYLVPNCMTSHNHYVIQLSFHGKIVRSYTNRFDNFELLSRMDPYYIGSHLIMGSLELVWNHTMMPPPLSRQVAWCGHRAHYFHDRNINERITTTSDVVSQCTVYWFEMTLTYRMIVVRYPKSNGVVGGLIPNFESSLHLNPKS